MPDSASPKVFCDRYADPNQIHDADLEYRVELSAIIDVEISLTPALEQFVKGQIENGNYSSATDVVIAAMRCFEEHEHIHKGRFDELRQEAMSGNKAAEQGELINDEVAFANLLTKLAKCGV
jgi:antitoxin ParD1/3/4